MRFTEKQAKELIGKAVHVQDGPIKPRKPRTTHREGKGPYHTHCHVCGVCFTTQASESRHSHSERHHRFEWQDGPCGQAA